MSECLSLLHNVVLQDNTIDRWRWSLDPIHGYYVKGVYTYLSTATVLKTMACQCLKVCGRNKCPLRCQCLLGNCSVIDYQLKTISSEEESFSMIMFSAQVGAVQVKPHITFFFSVIILAWCGIIFISG